MTYNPNQPQSSNEYNPLEDPEVIARFQQAEERVLGSMAVDLSQMGITSTLRREAFTYPSNVHRIGYMELANGTKIDALAPGLGAGHLALPLDPEDPFSREQNVNAARHLVWQMLRSHQPGTVKLSIFNGFMDGDFAGFHELDKLHEQVRPGELPQFLQRLSERQARLAHSDSNVGTTVEPWQIAVIVNNQNGSFSNRETEAINNLVAAGASYTSIITLGVHLRDHPAYLQNGWPSESIRPNSVRYFPAPPKAKIAEDCRAIAEEADRNVTSPSLSEVVSDEMWTASSRNGISIPFGVDVSGRSRRIYDLRIDNANLPHMLITGVTGSGKSNLVNAMITSMTQKYGPDQVQLQLLDYKEGVEFAGYGDADAPLPHATVVGKAINEDPEYGLDVLRRLQSELVRRGQRQRELGTAAYEALHGDPENNWPQIVLFVDEFHVLLGSEVGREAGAILTDISRRGRSTGIHLVLASQQLDEVRASLQFNTSLLGNLNQRITTTGGDMLNSQNQRPASVPPLHAVVNTQLGNNGDAFNHTVWIPNASSVGPGGGAELVDQYQRRAHALYNAQCAEAGVEPRKPHVFDGSQPPVLEDARAFRALEAATTRPLAMVAEMVNVEADGAGLVMERAAGNNIAIVGPHSRRDEVHRALHTAAASLGKQHTPGNARFSILQLSSSAGTDASIAADKLEAMGHEVAVIRANGAGKFLERVNQEIKDDNKDDSTPHYVFAYSADSGDVHDATEVETTYSFDDPESLKVNDGDDVSQHQTLFTKEKFQSVKPVNGGKVSINSDTNTLTVTSAGPSIQHRLYETLERGPEAGVFVIGGFSSVDGFKKTGTAPRGVGSTSSNLFNALLTIGTQPSELNGAIKGLEYTVTSTPSVDRHDRGLLYVRGKNGLSPVRIYNTGNDDN